MSWDYKDAFFSWTKTALSSLIKGLAQLRLPLYLLLLLLSVDFRRVLFFKNIASNILLYKNEITFISRVHIHILQKYIKNSYVWKLLATFFTRGNIWATCRMPSCTCRSGMCCNSTNATWCRMRLCGMRQCATCWCVACCMPLGLNKLLFVLGITASSKSRNISLLLREAKKKKSLK